MVEAQLEAVADLTSIYFEYFLMQHSVICVLFLFVYSSEDVYIKTCVIPAHWVSSPWFLPATGESKSFEFLFKN